MTAEASQPPASTPPESAAPASQPPASSSAAAGVGVPVKVGAWTITINAVKQTNSTNQFIVPTAGNVFWTLDITVINGTADAQLAGSGIRLMDDQDFGHDAELLGVTKPELGGNLPAGSKVRGFLTFQLAQGAKPVSVTFQPDLLDPSTIATISVK